MNKKYKKLFILTIIIAAFLLSGGIVLAQNLGVDYAANLGLTDGGGTDPRVYIVNIVRFLLAFVALAAVIVLLYGGFLWMTSAGNVTRLEKAKKTVIGAVIGLIIVIAAFAIVTFVINFTNQSLGPSCNPACSSPTAQCCSGNYCCDSAETCCQSTSGNDCCSGTEYCCATGCSAAPCNSIPGPTVFAINSTNPKDAATDVILNVNARFDFNDVVNAATVNYGTSFKVVQGGSLVAGTTTVSGKRITFIPDALCPSNLCGATKCFDPFLSYTISVFDVYSIHNMALTLMFNPNSPPTICGSGVSAPCSIDFTTSDIVDCDNPLVGFNNFNQACVSSAVPIDVWASDGSLVDNIELYVDGSLDNTQFNISSDKPFNANFIWDGSSYSSYSMGTPVTFTATAYDIDSHTGSVSKTLSLRAAHCCNGALDTTEDGVDCGGPDCAACDGAACGISLSDDCTIYSIDCHLNDDRCSSGFCECGGNNAACTSGGYDTGVNNCCLCESTPVINWVAPVGNFCEVDANVYCKTAGDCSSGGCNTDIPNGAVGNFVTIGGSSFGTTAGTVEFSDGAGGWVPAPLANTSPNGNPACGLDSDMWTDNTILVVVPVGAGEGPIRVTHAVSGNFDTTSGGDGPLIDDFLINTIVRPGLCDLSPDSGQLNDTLTYNGVRLSGGNAYFGNAASNIAALLSSFGAQLGTADVPNMANGQVTTFVQANGLNSNYLLFTKLAEAPIGPQIVSVDPGTGPKGQYVTITGSGFGSSRGSSDVFFGNETSGTPADFSFPTVCDAVALWNDNQVIIKVPSIDNGSYPITMLFFGTLAISTTDFGISPFSVDNMVPLTPGLCKLSYNVRTPTDDLFLYGENFGAGPGNVRFQLDQFPGGFAYWGGNAGDGERIETTVPLTAVTGPVRVIQGAEESNPLNLIVGSCLGEPTTACGAGFCCPVGTFYEGQCQASMNDCSIEVTASVYEWEFSTESGPMSGGPGSPCYDSSSATCTNIMLPECDTSAFPGIFCDDTSACTCQLPTNSFDSCYGQALATGQCHEGNFCPNSPGQCSLYAGGTAIPVGDCSDGACDGLGACDSSCTYNIGLNKCVSSNACNLSTTTLDVLDNTVTKYCDWFNPSETRWFINTPMSCPLGFTNVGAGRCVENGTSCTMCADGYDCLDDDGSGVCGINQNICPPGTPCTAGQCMTVDSGQCECCCRIDSAAQDCCAPLDCFGTCGTDVIDDGVGYGMCTGCADSPDPDAACNCEGSSGKYCDISSGPDRNNDGSPDGVCRDCSYMGSQTELCTQTTTCCVDNMNGDNCRGLDSGDILFQDNIDYCAYYECDGTDPSICDASDFISGPYYTRPECDADCPSNAPNPLGSKCISTPPACKSGVPDCGVFDCIDNGAGDDCRCCCNPAASPDQCELMNPDYDGLVCSPDKGDCSGPNRGLCCGCEGDASCGSADDIGCGTDTCCHQRPEIKSIFPASDAPSVCLNGVISAHFDQSMDIGSFSGNVILVGDYGTDPCPPGTVYLAAAGREPVRYGLFKRSYYKVAQAIKNIFSSLSQAPSASAYTPPSAGVNYCAIPGSAGGYNDLTGKGVLEFYPRNLMEGNKLYYLIIKGDKDLDSRSGIKNSFGVGFNGFAPGANQSPSGASAANNTFNGLLYANSYIWSFTSMDDQGSNSGVCEVSYVNLIPASYLFQRLSDDPNEIDSTLVDPSFNTSPDSDTLFVVEAKNSAGQTLATTSGYAWTWDWVINDTNVADFSPELAADPYYNARGGNAGHLRLVEASGTRTEGRTTIRSTIVMDTGNTYSMAGDGEFDESMITIFLCDNPWPPVQAGVWYPWRDEFAFDAACNAGTGTCHETNYEIFYCRDKGKFGTADDLPAIVSGSVLNFRDSGSASDGVIKESYFFREAVPSATTTLVLSDPQSGGTAHVVWTAVAGADGYKLYWGTRSMNYSDFAEIAASGATVHPDVSCAGLNCDVSGLANGTTYYFNISAITNAGAESGYHGEENIIVSDTSAPAGAPVLTASSSNGEVDLSWTAVAGAASYQVLYRIDTISPYGWSNNVGSDTGVIVASLTNGEDYYFIVRAVDAAGNEGTDSNEETVIPFDWPSELKAIATSSTEIDLAWRLLGDGVADVNIYWGTAPLDYSAGSASVGGYAEKYTVSGLSFNTRYYFIVRSANSQGEESANSNEASARTPF